MTTDNSREPAREGFGAASCFREAVIPSHLRLQGDREARDNLIDLIGSACDAYSAVGKHAEKQAVVRRYADAILAALPNTEGLVAKTYDPDVPEHVPSPAPAHIRRQNDSSPKGG